MTGRAGEVIVPPAPRRSPCKLYNYLPAVI